VDRVNAMQKIACYKSDSDNVALVQRYAPIVKRIAHHLMGRLPATVQLDDLIQAGMVGLLEAAKKYDGSKGASFETYAGIRIRGAMLDDVRKEDWAPRSVHRNARRISEAVRAVEARKGRDAQDIEVAEQMGVSLDEYYGYLQDSASARLFALDDLNDGDESTGINAIQGRPLDEVQQAHFKKSLAQAISSLPDRERLVLALYYKEELNLKEIGAVLGVSESRVSQIHSQAALRLRSRLTDWEG